MKRSALLLSALTKFVAGLVLISLLLFLPAGTFRFPGAILFILLLFVPMFLLGVVLLIHAPKLLEKRLGAKEKEKEQKDVVALSGLMFLFGFIIAGLDHRFSWSRIPGWVVICASIIFLISYALYGEVMRENAYLSRTIEVQEGQKVIDTGLYAIVRHPMYAVTLFLFLSIPLILGSWWSLICFLPYPILIGWRIRNEEEVLKKDLEGYREYTARVKYRLTPYIW